MVENFKLWLEGLLEDDPVPEEIDILLFNIKSNGEYKFIELIGYENQINSNAITYYPLESQFYWNHALAKQDNKTFIFEVKYIIEEAFASLILKTQLKNKKIYLKCNNEINYLFKVE